MIKFVCNNPKDFNLDYESIGALGLLQKIRFGVYEPESALLGAIVKAFKEDEAVVDVTDVFEFTYNPFGHEFVSRQTLWSQLKKFFRIESIKSSDDGNYIVEVGYVPEKKYTVEEMKNIAEKISYDFYNAISSCEPTDFEFRRFEGIGHYKYNHKKDFYINDDLFSADLFFYYYRLENDRGLAKDTFPGEEGSVKLTIRKKSIDRKDELVAGFCKMITKRYSCSVDSHVMGKRYTLEWKYSDKLINSEDALMDALKQKDNYCCLIGYDIIRDFYNLLKAKSKGDKTDDDMGARKKVGEVNDVMGNSRGYDNHFQMWEKLEKFYKAVSNNEGTIQDFFTSEGEAEFGSSDGPKPKR